MTNTIMSNNYLKCADCDYKLDDYNIKSILVHKTVECEKCKKSVNNNELSLQGFGFIHKNINHSNYIDTKTKEFVFIDYYSKNKKKHRVKCVKCFVKTH